MKKINLLIIVIFISSLGFSQAISPKLISSAGNSYINTNYQLDWSIGECITETHSNTSFVITQGFHQNKYNIIKVEDLAIEINITVYPNPTSNFLTVLWNNFPSYRGHENILTITDLNGKIILQDAISNKEKKINFSIYTNGVYFLTIKQENRLIKSFKIIKN